MIRIWKTVKIYSVQTTSRKDSIVRRFVQSNNNYALIDAQRRILRDYTENSQKKREDIVRAAWRHADPAEMAGRHRYIAINEVVFK